MTERRQDRLTREMNELAIRRMESRIGLAYHGMMVGLAVIGSTALVGSIPTIVLELLPRWAQISMVVGGVLLLGPSSVHETGRTKMWLDQAREGVKIKEAEVEDLHKSLQTFHK